MKQSSEELDQAKQKISQKDFFIQNQAKKLQQVQAENEKLKNAASDLEKQVKVSEKSDIFDQFFTHFQVKFLFKGPKSGEFKTQSHFKRSN
jgi:hypothetical protein